MAFDFLEQVPLRRYDFPKCSFEVWFRDRRVTSQASRTERDACGTLSIGQLAVMLLDTGTGSTCCNRTAARETALEIAMTKCENLAVTLSSGSRVI